VTTTTRYDENTEEQERTVRAHRSSEPCDARASARALHQRDDNNDASYTTNTSEVEHRESIERRGWEKRDVLRHVTFYRALRKRFSASVVTTNDERRFE